MSLIRLRLLGDPHVLDTAGRPSELQGRKTLALLACLAVARAPRPREGIMQLLWGDRFESQARQSLRQTIYALRKLLPDGSDLFVMSGETISLDQRHVSADVWDFERRAANEDLRNLEEAANLYRGPFLQGLSLREQAFSEWMAVEQARLGEIAWSVLYRLARQYKLERRHDDALSAARRLLDLDPLREKSHRLAMRILMAKGERALALRQFQQLTALLRQELGVEPDIETLRAYEEIKAGETVDGDVSKAPTERPSRPAGPDRFFSPLRPAVAVLPFKPGGGDLDLEHIAQGVAEDVAASLSSWRWFPVIGTSSSRYFSATLSDLAEIGRMLDARYAVTGSLRAAGGSLRLSVELTDLLSRHTLWAHRYEIGRRELQDVPEEITRRIVASIEPQVERAEQERALAKPEHNLTAWDLVLRANWHKTELTRQRNKQAIALYEEAIRLDPRLSLAWSHLAGSHWFEGILGWSDDPKASFEACDACAKRALALDDSDWLAHTLAGLSDMWIRRDHDASLARLNRAVYLNPSSSIANHAAACALEFAGMPGEALPHLRLILRLDPRYANNAAMLADMSLSYLQLGQFADAVTCARKSISFGPEYPRAYPRLVSALAHLGKRNEAERELARLFELQPNFSERYVRETYPFRDPRHLDLLLAGLYKAGLLVGA